MATRQLSGRVLRRFATAPRQFQQLAPCVLTQLPKFVAPARQEFLLAANTQSVASCVHEMRAHDILAAVSQTAAEPAATGKVAEEGLVFEVGLTFVFSHYKQVFISLMRNLFMTFRPVLIGFVMGQLFKAIFFMAGAPMLLSFYSVWIFEVFYGLLQCLLSFIFVSFFFNNLAFAGLRPMANLWKKQAQAAWRAARRCM
eukprot:GEMP01085194.1.p1 GENE.GEMP01085194.1~~GEMP01085194.1.p1  ORF type:complete len:213 (+),score=26.18 GEMP01085194.1:45-641(+)